MTVAEIGRVDEGSIRVMAAIRDVLNGGIFFDLIIEDLTGSIKITFPQTADVFPTLKNDMVIDLSGEVSANCDGALTLKNVFVRPRLDWDVSAFRVTPLKDLNKKRSNQSVRVHALVSDKKTFYKNDTAHTPYLLLKLQDGEHSMDNPLWDDHDYWNETLNIGDVVEITGQINFYQDVPQIKNVDIKVLSGEDADNYIPHYEVANDNVEYFTEVVDGMEDPYRRVAIAATGLMGDGFEVGPSDHQRWKDFFNCPAATSHHHNKIHGLFLHTIGMLKYIDSVEDNYATQAFFVNASSIVNFSRLRLKVILHDIRKPKEYDFKPAIRRKNRKCDHRILGATFVELLNEELDYPLSDEDVDDIQYSILCHHGELAENGKFAIKSIEDLLLHLADMTDSKIVGFVESDDKKQTMG